MDTAPHCDLALTKERIAALMRRSARAQATLAGVERQGVPHPTLAAQDPRLVRAWTSRLQEQLVDLRAAIELLEDGIGA